MSRIFFALLAMPIVCGIFVVLASPASAVNCDVNACISTCSKQHKVNSGNYCNSWCQISIEERQKKGQCKKQ